jgi:hypothetical protein
MSRMHVIAKIVATMLGIYLLISTVLMLLRSLIMVFLMGISGQPTPYWQVLASLLVTAGFIVAIFYFLIYRSDIIARKVVGQNNQVEPENLSVWYAVALRLTVIIAGFFFLWKTISILSMVSR